MILVNGSQGFTRNELQRLEKNLSAYEFNFGELLIYREPKNRGGHTYIFVTEQDSKEFNYIHYCDDIEYLNGWLYGIVQGDIVRSKVNERGV